MLEKYRVRISYWLRAAQMGVIWEKPRIHEFIYKDRMTSKYGHHDMFISLIDWIIVRANQSE